jgi:hypothetical protein
MIDKPIPAKIVLSLADENYNGEEFIGLSGTLYQERLIYGEPRELRKVRGKLELTVIFLDVNSFENWLKHPEIIEYWSDKFANFLTENPVTVQEEDVIIEVDKIFNCSCNNSDFFLLQGRAFQFTRELTCGNCFGNVPYSRIPLSIEIEQWQKHHERVYRNWLDSSFLEGSALRQLKNYKKGKLNLEGQKIRKELSEHFNIPVYLEYFAEEPDLQNNCPVCGSKGIKSGLKRPKKICKRCNIAFDYSG